mgnify:CR=1 FL=1
MNSIIIAAVMTATAVTTPVAEKPVKYFEVARQAIFNCPNKKFSQIKSSEVFELIALERKYKVPDAMRGMLLVMDCLESPKTTKNTLQKLRHWKEEAVKEKAVLNILDIKSTGAVKHSRFDKNNLKKTADITLRRITAEAPSGKKESLNKAWLKAWINNLQTKSPKKDVLQKHLLLLKKWHEKIKKTEKKIEEIECTC